MSRTTQEDEQEEQAIRAEQEAWVKEHGSSRLKKALELGLLQDSRGAYRDEVVAKMFPGWEAVAGRPLSLPINPELPEMLELEREREQHPDARLMRVKFEGDVWCTVIVIKRFLPGLRGPIVLFKEGPSAP